MYNDRPPSRSLVDDALRMNESSSDNLRAKQYLGLKSAGCGVRTLIRPLMSDLMPKPGPVDGLSPRSDIGNVPSSIYMISWEKCLELSEALAGYLKTKRVII